MESSTHDSSDWYDSSEVCSHNNAKQNASTFYASDEDEAKECNSSEYTCDEESLQEYREVVSTQFSSEEEGYQFYLHYAKRKCFSVRKDVLKYNPDGLPAFRKFCCSFAGFKRHVEPKIRATRPSKRVGCPAFLKVKLDPRSGKWYVYNFIDDHNHKLASTRAESNLLRSHRKIPDDHIICI